MKKSKILNIINSVLGFFALAVYLGMHTMLGFIGHATFSALPYILGVLMAISASVALANLLKIDNKTVFIVTFIFNIIATVGALAYFFAMLTHAKTFLIEIVKILAVYLFVAIVVYLIFYHGKLEYKGKRAVAIILCVVLVGGAVLGFTDLKTLRFNYITDGAAVYAVGDEYQIVWTTRAKGIGWVEIGGQCYYDEYSGAKRSKERVHKVTVKQDILDSAGEYTVKSRAILSEQGFSGLLGYTVKSHYKFRPVDASDGIQAYAVSDTHDYNGIVKKTAAYYGDKLDFIVMAGDAVSFLYTETDLARILKLCNLLTNGERPVVFARGNHEVKCEGAENLHRYVGANGESFYYTFRMKNVWGVVLDMGEDHADDWYEFYDTAIYDGYRQRQVEFLDEIIENKALEYGNEGVEYRIGVCHTPTAFTSYSMPYSYDALVAINDRLNQMKLDVMINGHYHEVFAVESGYEAGRVLTYDKKYDNSSDGKPLYLATGATYKSVVVSRRSDVQDPGVKENFFGRKFIGAAVELIGNDKTVRFTNAKKEVIFTVSPFDGTEYGKIYNL